MQEIVRARIDGEVKLKAVAALDAMGLSVSDAIRLFLMRVAEEQRLPFEVKVPNSATREAIREIEEGHGRRSTTLDAFWDDMSR